MPDIWPQVVKWALVCKIVVKCFGGSIFFCNFAAMEQQYIITGINRLTGNREPISLKMSHAAAILMVTAYKVASRKGRRLPYLRPRIEKAAPRELELIFLSNDSK